MIKLFNIDMCRKNYYSTFPEVIEKFSFGLLTIRLIAISRKFKSTQMHMIQRVFLSNPLSAKLFPQYRIYACWPIAR